MLLTIEDITSDLNKIEEVERMSLRLVVQALFDYRKYAADIFEQESDMVADIGEDITREAMDRIGTSRIDERLFGKIDYKRARYLFHPDYSLRQALFVDSKAEKITGQGTATLQLSQLSMKILQVRSGVQLEHIGRIPCIISIKDQHYISTTIFVKYNYQESSNSNILKSITVAALPNGILQQRYNPTAIDTIFLAGRNAPTLGEEFRVRLSFSRLKSKTSWRVQHIRIPCDTFIWEL